MTMKREMPTRAFRPEPRRVDLESCDVCYAPVGEPCLDKRRNGSWFPRMPKSYVKKTPHKVYVVSLGAADE
jgi:hypothetical protein